MGERHARSRADLARTRASEQTREAEARRAAVEQQRQELSSLLGSEEQFQEFDRVPDQFLQRYQVDFESLGPLANTRYFGPSGSNRLDPAAAQTLADEANAILDQAQAAAAEGDFARAEQLRAQAKERIGTLHGAVQVYGKPYAAVPFAFNLITDPRQAALAKATTTEGRIVGRRLQQALELQDTGSEEFQRRREMLFDPYQDIIQEGVTQAERAIAAERRQAEADLRTGVAAGLGGAGRQVYAERSARRDIADRTAQTRAGVYTTAAQQRAAGLLETNQFLLEFADSFSARSVELAQAWVAGGAGIRDNVNNALDRIDLFQSQQAFDAFKIYHQEYLEKYRVAQSKEAFRRKILTQALLTLGGAALGGIAGPALGIGAAAGAQIGGQLGGQAAGGGGGGADYLAAVTSAFGSGGGSATVGAGGGGAF